MSQSPPPTDMLSDPIRPGRWWYAAAAVILIASVAVGWSLMSSVNPNAIIGRIEDWPHIGVPGQYVAPAGGTGRVGFVAIEAAPASQKSSTPQCEPSELVIVVQDEAGQPMQVMPTTSKPHDTPQGRQISLGYVQVDTPQRLEISVAPPQGKSFSGTFVISPVINEEELMRVGMTIVFGMGIAGGGIVLATIIALVVLVKRSKALRRQSQAMGTGSL